MHGEPYLCGFICGSFPQGLSALFCSRAVGVGPAQIPVRSVAHGPGVLASRRSLCGESPRLVSTLRLTDLWVFIDNDGARAALSKAFSGRPEGAQIIHDAITLEETLGVNVAFFRVPTSSNIADGPSKDQWDEPHTSQKGGAVVRGEQKGILRRPLCTTKYHDLQRQTEYCPIFRSAN